ncbi:hypothetical protein [Pectobacterium polaris]|uniref:DUF302 domain-containing protein n=1 Tax=Pectobacterium polaris TaxID=2042057 RepID=A0AAW4P5C8_9GAMM|nr:hypothetical protein [Pectobacterium polaris]MBN3215551.1 hypothetical protein [Pectobacterium polaris]MBW5894504.1 hypothetical protein [Pectobacterium polaris]
MAFSDDNGGFAFSCDDAKMSISASTWKTRLSQLARVYGPVYIMTGQLSDAVYISEIIGKRPHDLFIIANTAAKDEAQFLKGKFPKVHIALHPKINAKVVLLSPDTVWISSADFGKSTRIESAIGMHSHQLFNKTVVSLFNRIWNEATELT